MREKDKKRKIMIWLFYLLGTFCLCYYIIIISYAGIGAAFSPIWLVFTAGFYGIGILMKMELNGTIHLPIFLKGVLPYVIRVGILCFMIVEGILIFYGTANPDNGADYMIILGAKVNGTVPSKTLRARVMSAIPYLKENPYTKVIVSGGQGKDEQVTEAFAMKELLLGQGIESQRIIMEEQSINTVQNIRFSKELMLQDTKKGIDETKVLIVTSDFHIFRGISIAKKQGLTQVSGCPSKSDPILMVHYYIREFFAVVKDKVFHHI